MSQQPINKDVMLQIYKLGSYYNPATNHYGYEANVTCDRCFKSHLSICIGWQTYDLCLPCVNEINKEINKEVKKKSTPVCKTNMEQSQFKTIKTMMLQSQYNLKNGEKDDDNSYKTYMLQNIFKTD